VNFTFTGFLGGIQQYVFNAVEPGRPPGTFGFDTIITPDASIAIHDARMLWKFWAPRATISSLTL